MADKKEVMSVIKKLMGYKYNGEKPIIVIGPKLGSSDSPGIFVYMHMAAASEEYRPQTADVIFCLQIKNMLISLTEMKRKNFCQ